MIGIEIKNKLEIMPGNMISVPGCEPISSMSSLGLQQNFHCNASVIPVEDVLKLIPGSRIVRAFAIRGHIGTGLFIELPAGPPTSAECPSPCQPDWYAILRANARTRAAEEEPDVVKECAGFNFSGCQIDYNPLDHPADPNRRPNDAPIGAS